MTWAVLDTNTLVSGMGWAGLPSEVVDLAVRGHFTLVTSPALLNELAEVIQRPRLAPYIPDPLGTVLLIERMAVVVEPTRRVTVLADDADNRVLEAALAASADYIVTGDKPFLALGEYEGTRITTARDFLGLFG